MLEFCMVLIAGFFGHLIAGIVGAFFAMAFVACVIADPLALPKP